MSALMAISDTCCEHGQRLGVRVCPSCAEISAAYSSACSVASGAEERICSYCGRVWLALNVGNTTLCDIWCAIAQWQDARGVSIYESVRISGDAIVAARRVRDLGGLHELRCALALLDAGDLAEPPR